MRTSDVVSFFGGVAKTAKALKVARATVYNWGDTVPVPRNYQVEVITKGKLRAESIDANTNIIKNKSFIDKSNDDCRAAV